MLLTCVLQTHQTHNHKTQTNLFFSVRWLVKIKSPTTSDIKERTKTRNDVADQIVYFLPIYFCFIFLFSFVFLWSVLYSLHRVYHFISKSYGR